MTLVMENKPISINKIRRNRARIWIGKGMGSSGESEFGLGGELSFGALVGASLDL
jgi:hypothetical protein